uniref:Uncharacterized protein n=1 Tax=Arundo donax TaxID=35708 RepID=A0A0A9B9N8_ARUDO
MLMEKQLSQTTKQAMSGKLGMLLTPWWLLGC